jgi:hypothetical protein
MLCEKTKPLISEGYGLIVQITLMFVFLTVFFFAYVTEVERSSFERQMNIVVDNLMSDIDTQIPDFVQHNKIDTSQFSVIVNGTIDVEENKLKKSTTSATNKVNSQNKKVLTTAFIALGVTCGIVTIIGVVIYFGFKICLPITRQLTNALIAVAFVALTELIFLTIIASKYNSASPNAVRRQIAKSTQQWVAAHKKT